MTNEFYRLWFYMLEEAQRERGSFRMHGRFPRRSGKSTWLAMMAVDGDLILCPNARHAEMFEADYPVAPGVSVLVPRDAQFRQPVRRIWVDEWDLFPKAILYEIHGSIQPVSTFGLSS